MTALIETLHRSADMTSSTIDLNGPVHVAEYGGSGDPVILIHGLGGSHVNWISIAESMRSHGRVVAPDLIGFGLTPPKGRRALLDNQADLIVDLIHRMGSQPALLVGNSMGGLISLMVAAANPELVRGVVLLDPAMPVRRLNMDPRGLVQVMGPHLPILGLAIARGSWGGPIPERYIESALSMIVADPQSISDDALQAHVELAKKRMRMPWLSRTFGEAGRSTVAALLSRRSYADMARAVEAPVMLIHGRRDRVVHVSAAKWLAKIRPDWRVELLNGVGHVPQLEVPDLVAELIADWIPTVR